MCEGSLPGLRLCAGPEPDGTALHEHDRMVTVPARDRCGQAEDIFHLRPARDRLEADGGDMVALVNHEMPVIGDDVVHLPLAHQALDDGDIDDAARLAPAAADLPDRGCREIEKRREPRDPLFHELAAVDEHQRVGPAGRDDGRGDDRLAEPGRRGEHAGLVGQQSIGGGLLFRGQASEKSRFNRTAGIAPRRACPGGCPVLQATPPSPRRSREAGRCGEKATRRRRRCAGCRRWSAASPGRCRRPGSGRAARRMSRLTRPGGKLARGM